MMLKHVVAAPVIVVLLGAFVLSGCSSTGMAPAQELNTAPTTQASTILAAAVPSDVLCTVIGSSNLELLGVPGAAQQSASDAPGNTRCTFSLADPVPSETVLQLVSNTDTPSGDEFDVPDLSSQNCTNGNGSREAELGEFVSAVWWCLDSITSRNKFGVSSFYSNSTFYGTSLRCEISVVNRALEVSQAEAWCADILRDLDASL